MGIFFKEEGFLFWCRKPAGAKVYLRLSLISARRLVPMTLLALHWNNQWTLLQTVLMHDAMV